MCSKSESIPLSLGKLTIHLQEEDSVKRATLLIEIIINKTANNLSQNLTEWISGNKYENASVIKERLMSWRIFFPCSNVHSIKYVSIRFSKTPIITFKWSAWSTTEDIPITFFSGRFYGVDLPLYLTVFLKIACEDKLIFLSPKRKQLIKFLALRITLKLENAASLTKHYKGKITLHIFNASALHV